MYEENEISLKELILILLNEKKLIAIITVSFTVLAIFVTLMLPKVYETQSQINYNLPVNNETRFGAFIFPSQNIADYLPLLTSDEVKNEVASKLGIEANNVNPQIVYNKENKYIFVKTTASTPELAKQINDALVETYIYRVRVQYKLESINKFISFYQNSITSDTFKAEKTQSMLTEKQTFLMELNPKYTLQKAIFADSATAALYADKFNLDFSTLSNDVILEEYASEKYLQIEAEVIDLRSALIYYSENLKFSEKLLAELNEEKNQLLLNLKTNEYNSILNDELDVLNNSISQVSKAILPVSRISPRNSVNVGLGFIVGFTLSIFYIILKHYWKSEEDL